MNGKKLFAALILLTILSTIIAAQIAKAAPNENTAHIDAISCIHPISAKERVTCANLEAQILAVTVRIELLTWGTTDGSG